MNNFRCVQIGCFLLLIGITQVNSWACYKCNDRGIIVMKASTNAEGAFEDTISLSGQSDWYFCDCAIGRAKRAEYFKQNQDKAPANTKVERPVVSQTENSLIKAPAVEPQKESQDRQTFPVDGKLVAVEAPTATREQDGSFSIHGSVSNKCGQSIRNVQIKFAFKRKDGTELFVHQKNFRAVVEGNEKKNFDLKFSEIPDGSTYTISATFEYVDAPPKVDNPKGEPAKPQTQPRKPSKLAEALAGSDAATGLSAKVEKSSKESRSAEARKLLSMARNFSLNGRIDDARENLNSIIHDFSDTPEVEEARKELAKLK